jgi:hypothetical protein
MRLRLYPGVHYKSNCRSLEIPTLFLNELNTPTISGVWHDLPQFYLILYTELSHHNRNDNPVYNPMQFKLHTM